MNNSAVKNCSLFKGLDEETLKRALLEMEASLKSYARGESLNREGDRLPGFGLVTEGTIHVLSYDLEGQPTVMATVSAGETFGESLCYLKLDSVVHIHAVTPAKVLWLNTSCFAKEGNKLCEELHRRFTTMLAWRALNMNDRIQVLSKLSLREKLNTLFSQYSHKFGSEFELPFDRERMAAYLGADRSALSRELSRMKKEGLIDFRKNRFRIIK